MAIGLGGILTGVGMFAQDYLKKRQADQQMEINRQLLDERNKLAQARGAAGRALSAQEDAGGTGGLSVESPGGGYGGYGGLGPASFGDSGSDSPPMRFGGGSVRMGIPTSRPMTTQGTDDVAALTASVPEVGGGTSGGRPPGLPPGVSPTDPPREKLPAVPDFGGRFSGKEGPAYDPPDAGADTSSRATFTPGVGFQGGGGSERVSLPPLAYQRAPWEGARGGAPQQRPQSQSRLVSAVAQDPVLRPALQQSGQAAQRTAQTIDPSVYGRMSIQSLARQIDKANPGLDPEVKFLALEQANKLLNPTDQRLWQMMLQSQSQNFQMMMEQYRERARSGERAEEHRFQIGMEDKREEGRRRAAEEARGDRPEHLFEDDQGQQQWLKPGQPIPPGWHATSATANRPGASKNIEVSDADGKTVFSGAARETPTGWVRDDTKQPLQVPEGGVIHVSSAANVGRQQQMVGRLSLAGNEIPAALHNLVQLPITATAGVFGGVQGESPKTLADGIRRALANELTPQDAQDVLVSFQGVSRNIAAIEAAGAAQGLVGLTQRADVLMPRAGDTGETILRKYAEIRQLTERGLASLKNMPGLTDKQQKALSEMIEETRREVPWTVEDVNNLKRGKGESVLDFARKIGAAKSGGAQAGGRSMPIPQGLMNSEGKPATEGDGFTMKDGSQWMVRGGKLVPAPAGGEATQPIASPVY